MTAKKMAVLRLNPDALREILQLPDGAEVVRIDQVPGYRGLVNVVVEGVGWDVHEGGPLPPSTQGVVTVDRGEQGEINRMTVDWGLPGGIGCGHKNTQAIDPARNAGFTLKCVDCGWWGRDRGGAHEEWTKSRSEVFLREMGL